MRPCLPTVCLIAALAATPALANDTVTVEVQGDIEPSCGLDSSEKLVDLGTFDGPGIEQFQLVVDCNAPFAYSITSDNGGLQHEGGVVFVGSFTELLPYELEMTLPVTDPAGTLTETCTSAQLEGPSPTCGSGNSDDSIAIGETATFTVSWSSPPHPMLAGLFADRLTFTVSVQP